MHAPVAKPIGIPFRLKDLWMYPLVPIPLAVIFTSPQPTWDQQLSALGVSYLANLLTTVCMGAPIHAAYVALLPRVTANLNSKLLRFLVQAAVIVIGVIVGSVVAAEAVGLCVGWRHPHGALGLVQVGLVVSVVCVVSLNVLARLRERVLEAGVRKQRAETALVRAQLEALRARTNPHFLFNSLNSVAGLVAEDPTAAEKMLERMAAVFRYALDGSKRETVPLRVEVAAVRAYLDVEEIRFGSRLRVRLEIPPEASDCSVPSGILQPLVENAINHGIAQLREGGELALHARRDDRRLEVIVENPTAGPSNHRGTGTSLADLRERLRLLHGTAASVEEELRGRTHRVTVTILAERQDS